jgi:hypothetical protein
LIDTFVGSSPQTEPANSLIVPSSVRLFKEVGEAVVDVREGDDKDNEEDGIKRVQVSGKDLGEHLNIRTDDQWVILLRHGRSDGGR